ncbi:TetR/AcrR family transcriptional regulator [Acidipila sp. EB88]|uniref:TetR/AcrR family transcriptional regulator n=1 Tax=Acidipila sp. EB88 TaxID=2305226 RepID=UPI000F5FFEF6|nr:TetR/AcrR family transcriptional regulator [Acidipila sp. EB88]RRA50495.1 TetR family transcriptional regulator [Acidipila sp. EB88]
MPRNGEKVRKSLQWAALELFRDRGYEETTAADIAAKAGVTERTFFRHFADKRDVLFDGEAAFSEALTQAIRNAPKAFGPWDTLLFSFGSVKQMFIDNRPFTEPRQYVIAATPALQERAMAKTRSLVTNVTSALCERGVSEPEANLVAWMGMAASSYGVAAWFKDNSMGLGEHMAQAFEKASRLSQSNFATTKTTATSSEPRARGR